MGLEELFQQGQQALQAAGQHLVHMAGELRRNAAQQQARSQQYTEHEAQASMFCASASARQRPQSAGCRLASLTSARPGWPGSAPDQQGSAAQTAALEAGKKEELGRATWTLLHTRAAQVCGLHYTLWLPSFLNPTTHYGCPGL